MENTQTTTTLATATSEAARSAGVLTPGIHPEEPQVLNWLRQLVATHSQAAAAAICGISATTISRLLAGSYTGDRARMLERVSQAMDNEMSRTALAGERGFFETSLSRTIWQECEFTRIFGSLNRIIGHTQIGKTTALAAYQREHMDTWLITLSTGITLGGIIRTLAGALGCTAHQYSDRALDEFAARLTRNSLLLVDEAHQVASRPGGAQVMEFLRALHDRTHCGILICGTYLLDSWMREGRAAAMMAQLIKRGTTTYLKSYATRADLAALATNYNMPELTEEALAYAAEVVRESGFGEFCKMLERSVYVASRQGRPATWEFCLAVMDARTRQAEEFRNDKR